MSRPSPDRIFNIANEQEFQDLALEIFHYQSRENPVYYEYINLLGINPANIGGLRDIPFMPVEFFRDHKVITGEARTEIVFESSGTTSSQTSRHYITDVNLYRESFLRGFELFYGHPSDYCIMALLPSYLERDNSSLVYMARELIRESRHPESGFYLDDTDSLAKRIRQLDNTGQNIILLGVSFALANLAEKYSLPLHNTIVMETGGMKGRRKEMTREELHNLLKSAFGIDSVHSEYGMTEMLSQAYSKSDGIFHYPPWMKIVIRDPYDPLTLLKRETSGGINIIDLANVNSCSFIATQDIGKISAGVGFEVLGRFDNSDIRGCNLMVE